MSAIELLNDTKLKISQPSKCDVLSQCCLMLDIKDNGPIVKQECGLLSHLIIYIIYILMVE